MRHHEASEEKTLAKAKRRDKKRQPAMKMSGKGMKRFAGSNKRVKS